MKLYLSAFREQSQEFNAYFPFFFILSTFSCRIKQKKYDIKRELHPSFIVTFNIL